ncbi:MAG: response regulator [Candidatus Altiarchaeota archaeon]|nr:response regulator [Candidatus Altiarchaeota archaeon]
MNPEGISILLVEDEEDDVIVTKRAFEESSMNPQLYVASDGLDALQQLGIEDGIPAEEHKTPQLILLDLNMDRMDGFEFLQILRSNEMFKSIPVIVLSSSDRQNDVNRAYEVGANNYIVKPVDVHDFKRVISAVEDYWFVTSKIPKAKRTISS